MPAGTPDPNVFLSAKFLEGVTGLFGWNRSVLKDCITMKPFTGGGLDDYSDGIDDTDGEAAEVTTRYGDSPHREPNNFRRRLRMKQYDDGKLLDRIDLAKFTPHDPTDAITSMLQASVEKKIERAILEGMVGTAYGGQDGTTTYAFDTTNMRVAVGDWTYGAGTGNTGMTVSKILLAKEKLVVANDFSDAQLGGDPVYMALTQHEISQLCQYEEITNGDYMGEAKALKSGEISMIAGVNIKRLSDRRMPKVTTSTANDTRRCLMWMKSGIEGRDGALEAWVRNRDDKKGIPYAYINKFFGTTRVDEKKICDILCLI